jgi:hypothetical protein
MVPLLNKNECQKYGLDLSKNIDLFFSQTDLNGSIFLLKNLTEENEIIGFASTFEEFTDWRGELEHWIYDFRILKKYEKCFKGIVGKFNCLFVREIQSNRMTSVRWVVFEQDEEVLKGVLEGQGFVIYPEQVMCLKVNQNIER